MRMLAVLFALFLTACAETPESMPMCAAPPDTGTPFGQALQRSALHYGNKVTPEQLALAGLSGLSRLDPTLKITREPPRVVMQVPDQPITKLTIFSGRDVSSWRDKAVDIIGTAKELSPVIAATSTEGLQETLVAVLQDAYPTPEVVRIPCPPVDEVVEVPKTPDHCYGVPYGRGKVRTDPGEIRTPPIVAGADKGALSSASSQRYVLMDRPLTVPPEITRIQRGYVEYWVGGFTNDGRSPGARSISIAGNW